MKYVSCLKMPCNSVCISIKFNLQFKIWYLFITIFIPLIEIINRILVDLSFTM